MKKVVRFLKRLIIYGSIAFFVIIVSFLFYIIPVFDSSEYESKQGETVLDGVVHLERKFLLNVPYVGRFCDELELWKGRVNIGDCELYVEQEGEGVPVVLLHGGPGATHHYLHPHFSKAKAFARIIYYDQRGCGLSDYAPEDGYIVDQAVDDLENLRKALNIDEWVVLGHSYGGALAQCYSLKYPGSVAGMVLVSARATITTHREPSREYDFITTRELLRIRATQAMYFFGFIQMDRMLYNAFLNGDWKRQNFSKPSKNELAQLALYEWKHDTDFNSMMSRDLRQIELLDGFKHCPIPRLIIEGKWDLSWPADKPKKFHENHPGSKLIIFENSGHRAFGDEPERFFQVLHEFVKNLPYVEQRDIDGWKEYLGEWKQKE
jgi:proline iminopeptidase